MTKKIMVFIPTTISSEIHTPVIQYMFQLAYDIEGKYPDKLEWLPAYIWQPNKTQIWQAFVDSKPDIVCLSMYLWSAEILHYLAKRIREESPETVILLGGPEVDWKDPTGFSNKYPYYDYICYGDGEQTFIDLIDAIFDNKTTTLDLLNIKNLIFKDTKGKVHNTPHQLYKGKVYTHHSPWIHCKETFVRDCNEIKARTGNAPIVAWESDRGCPYDCSFCDWESGLHHKVIAKKYDHHDEIELFAEQSCKISFNNANFGIYEKDLKSIEHIWKLQKAGRIPRATEPSWAKLHKDRVHAIYRMRGDIFGEIECKVPLQSITPQVLENIDRPAIPWTEYKKMLIDLKKDYTLKFLPVLMTGLPGETRESWDQMLIEFTDLAPLWSMNASPWHMLPTSPGADAEYIKKHKIKVTPTIFPMYDTSVRPDLDWTGYTDEMITERMLHSIENDELPISYRSDVIWEHYSAGLEENLYMQYAVLALTSLTRVRNETKFLKKNYNSLRPHMWDRAQRDGEKFRKLLDKYGVMPFYVLADNKLYNSTTLVNTIKIRDFINLSAKP